MLHPNPLEMDTSWRRIDEFPDYLIDGFGMVMNEWTSHVLRPRFNNEGFSMVNLVRNKKLFTRSTAILVAKMFLDPPLNDAYNSVIHLNGDRADCRVMNLMWRPRWFSIKYHQMFAEEPLRVAVEIPEIGKMYHSLREACTTHGLVERSTYISMINKEPCFHYGWFFERFSK